MPRQDKSSSQGPNSFVASAAQITSRRRRGVPKSNTSGGWQSEAWQMLDEVGELEFFREWIANALSKVKLYVVEETVENGKKVKKRVEQGLPVEALAALYDGEAGQPQMLASMAGHLAIPGETWLVGLLEPSDQADGPDLWRVLSRDELKQEGSQWVIDRGDGEEERYEDGSKDGVAAQALVIRLWRPHPRKWVEAHSSVRSALPILRQLVAVGKRAAAELDSRLAGNGMLLMPTEATFGSPTPGTPGADVDPELDPFIRDLTDMMMAAYRDQGSAEAMVPAVVKMPGMWLDKVKHLTFASTLSDKLSEREDKLIRRLANDLDVPAEVLLGLADVNHWTGWLLDDNAIKMHVEPLVEVLCHGLTTRYLWPAMQGQAATLDPALRRFTLEGDVSELRQKANQAEAADDAHAKGLITDAAWARARGFDTSDLLSDPANAEEFKRRLLQELAGGVTTADVTVAAAAALGVIITPKPSEVTPDPGAVEGPQAPAELPAGGGEQGPPEQPTEAPAESGPPQAQAAALLLGSEAVVLRALERARNRHGARGGRRGRTTVAPDQLEACLAGAWDYVPRVAALSAVDEDRLLLALNQYARTLLVTGAEHDPLAFATMLRDRVLATPPEALSA